MTTTATSAAPVTPEDAQLLYNDILPRAMDFAERHLPRDQALEVAHEVASALSTLSPERITNPLIYVAVNRRLRDYWRGRSRRAAFEGAYQEMRASTTPGWAAPGTEIELRELQQRIADTIDKMPEGMRNVFLLIREKELSYKQAASLLGVGVGTIHTQLSRAMTLLREAVALFQAGEPSTATRRGQRNDP